MNYNSYEEKDLYSENLKEENFLMQDEDNDTFLEECERNDNDDDDDYASQDELDALEDDMFPDGVDDDNYPDLSDSD